MSEMKKSEEPMIIKTDRPHSVSMPEGTNVAVGKKGEAGTPAIRKVLADGENKVVENVVMDGGISASSGPSKDVMAKGESYKGHQSKEEGQENYKGYQGSSDSPDRFIAQPKEATVPPPVKKSIDVSQLENVLKSKASETGVDTTSNESENQVAKPATQVASAMETMPEMNFPARVIKVKIENDQVRARLENLE